MADRVRREWSRHIDQVLRSQHYSWLAEGLSGAPLEEALINITADIMHICKRQGIEWESLLDKSQTQFEEEEVARHEVHATRRPHPVGASA